MRRGDNGQGTLKFLLEGRRWPVRLQRANHSTFNLEDLLVEIYVLYRSLGSQHPFRLVSRGARKNASWEDDDE